MKRSELSFPLVPRFLRFPALSRSFTIASWLGWQIESNWADPFLFAVYSVAKPIASAMILVVMYNVITHGNTSSPIFPYIYLGNAFYIYVATVMTGVSWAVIDDREHYRTLKYIYIAPLRVPFYLLGRGVVRFIIGSISVFITVAFGVLFLKVPLHLSDINWLMFFAALFLGVFALAMMGLVLAGVTLLIANHVWFVGEAVAGALYLFSGAIFPLDILPQFLRPIGFLMPLTYWLELIRRSLLGHTAAAFPSLAAFSNAQLFGILVGLATFFTLLAFVVFRYCDFLARERGMIDMTTNY
ncbi:MAG: ABC transporter permease [Chloroflexi bacterium]|nr:ABC transporter permease [Chloroflexota bacterium]